MNKRSLDAIHDLQDDFEDCYKIEFRNHANLWAFAALLCKIADTESLLLSEEVRQIFNNYPDGMDDEHSVNELFTDKNVTDFFRRRWGMIYILKSEIDKFARIAEQAKAEAIEKKVLAPLPGYDPAKQGKGGQR